MAELIVRFDVRFGGRAARAFMAAAMFFATVPELASESVTLTTYYPAPSGVYANLITTGNTYLARDGGAVRIGSNVAPAYTLDVTGNEHVSNGLLVDNGLTVNGGETENGTLTVNGGITGNYGLMPGYAGWAAYGTGAGGAAIYNDAGSYRTLMIVGNNSAGGVRQVSVWDNLNVNGSETINGNLTVNGNVTATGNIAAGGAAPGSQHYLYATGASCYASNANNGWCAGGYYITWAPGVFENNAAYWWYEGPTPTIWSGGVGQLVESGWGGQAYTAINFNTPVYWCCAM